MDLRKAHIKVSEWISEIDLISYFEQFGEVKDVVHKYDPITGDYRHFCYILFADAQSARRAV